MTVLKPGSDAHAAAVTKAVTKKKKRPIIDPERTIFDQAFSRAYLLPHWRGLDMTCKFTSNLSLLVIPRSVLTERLCLQMASPLAPARTDFLSRTAAESRVGASPR